MKFTTYHRWDVSSKDAVEIQRNLRTKIILKKGFDKIKRIAGIDVSFYRSNKKGQCAIIICSYPELQVIEKVIITKPIKFPYIPGLLTFREGPIILSCYKKIKNIPDLLIFDGHGIAHPRRMGIAAHMGIILDKPAIGCAKNLLYGSYREPAKKQGSFSYIRNNREIIGAAVRTRDNVRCVFVSPGHKIGLKESIEIVLGLSCGYRIPQPLRIAHTLSKVL